MFFLAFNVFPSGKTSVEGDADKCYIVGLGDLCTVLTPIPNFFFVFIIFVTKYAAVFSAILSFKPTRSHALFINTASALQVYKLHTIDLFVPGPQKLLPGICALNGSVLIILLMIPLPRFKFEL